MKNVFATLLLVLLPLICWPQSEGCGIEQTDTTDAKAFPWYGNNDYLENLVNQVESCPNCRTANFSSRVFKIPVKAWVYTSSSGGSINATQAEQYINQVNEFYRQNGVSVQLYLKCGVTFTQNNDYYSNPSEQMWQDNYDDHALNVHFVHDGTINKGRFPWKARRYSCWVITGGTYSFQQAIVLAHEIGHCFGLLHTFESARESLALTNGSAGNCYQESVSRTRTQGFACISTIGQLKSVVNGDYLRDTEADPGIEQGDVDFGCNYLGNLGNDNWGDAWTPPVRNFMTYGRRACRSQFTRLQRGVMYYFIQNYQTEVGKFNVQNEQAFYNNSDIDDFENDNFRETAAQHPIGSSYYHTFHHVPYNNGSCDIDWARFTANSSLIRIATSAFGQPQPNTRLTLFDNAGNQITQNDDANGTVFSQIDISTLTPGAEYFVRVENLSPYPSDEAFGQYILSITNPSPPALSVIINGSSFIGACERGEWTATATGGTGNYNFEWYINSSLVGNGNLYARYNDNTFTENFTLEVRVNDGSSQVSDFKQVYFEGCPSGSRTFLVYPNPASDQFNVEFRDNSSKTAETTTAKSEGFELKLFDGGNQEIAYKRATNNEKVNINVKSFPKGTYFLHIFYNEAVIKKQIVIENK